MTSFSLFRFLHEFPMRDLLPIKTEQDKRFSQDSLQIIKISFLKELWWKGLFLRTFILEREIKLNQRKI